MAPLRSALLPACFALAGALDNGVARLPYMGYNTWYDFMCNNINASNVMKLADTLVDLGLDKLGYTYLNLDDCWAVSRDKSTNVVKEDPKAFPDGMKALADYVHGKGLLFGIYTDRGTATCAGRPGSQGFEDVDAKTYAAWGVDLVKEDSCNAEDTPEAASEQYGKMRDALNKTGRPMVFNLCGWHPWYAQKGAGLSNSWRINYDGSNWNAVVVNALTNAAMGGYASPGAWNDPDFLLGSSPGAAVYLTETQSRMQFSLWSVMAAPLIIGSNLLHMSIFDLATYTNMEVIAVDQDPLGTQGAVVWGNCPSLQLPRASKSSAASFDVPNCQQIWAKPLADGGHAVAFINLATGSANVTCDDGCFAKMGYVGGKRPANVRDLWMHSDLSAAGTTISRTLDASGGFALLRFLGGSGPAKVGSGADLARKIVV